jgi:hypothetical protein
MFKGIQVISGKHKSHTWRPSTAFFPQFALGRLSGRADATWKTEVPQGSPPPAAAPSAPAFPDPPRRLPGLPPTASSTTPPPFESSPAQARELSCRLATSLGGSAARAATAQAQSRSRSRRCCSSPAASNSTTQHKKDCRKVCLFIFVLYRIESFGASRK